MASEAFETWWSRNGWTGPDAEANAQEVWDESRRQAVEACAAEAEKGACTCAHSVRFYGRQRKAAKLKELANGRHFDEACPKALAARLRRLA